MGKNRGVRLHVSYLMKVDPGIKAKEDEQLQKLFEETLMRNSQINLGKSSKSIANVQEALRMNPGNKYANSMAQLASTASQFDMLQKDKLKNKKLKTKKKEKNSTSDMSLAGANIPSPSSRGQFNVDQFNNNSLFLPNMSLEEIQSIKIQEALTNRNSTSDVSINSQNLNLNAFNFKKQAAKSAKQYQ